jgi:hypothetical protein
MSENPILMTRAEYAHLLPRSRDSTRSVGPFANNGQPCRELAVASG